MVSFNFLLQLSPKQGSFKQGSFWRRISRPGHDDKDLLIKKFFYPGESGVLANSDWGLWGSSALLLTNSGSDAVTRSTNSTLTTDIYAINANRSL